MDCCSDVLTKDNPFIPPKGTRCPVNDIPPELLSLIFEVGAKSIKDGEDEDEEDEEDEAMAVYWNLESGAKDGADEDGETTKRSRVTRNDGIDEDGLSESSMDSDATFEPMPSFEVLISHVCHHWRVVALNTPSLWTEIDVSPLDSPPFERVQTFLERSKSLPIDIRIDCEPPDDDEEEDSSGSEDSELGQSPHSMTFSDLDNLMSLLVPHISRWGSVEVAVACYKHMFIFLSAVSDPSITGAPQLEALQLYHHEDAESLTAFAQPDLVQHFKLFGGVAPRLKSVALWGVHVDWCQEWLSCGSNLLDLELAYHTDDVRPSWTQFAAILCGAPKLETLSLCSSGPLGAPHDWCNEGSSGSYGNDYTGVIELRSLTQLVLAFHSPVYVSGLLRRLAFPALKSLTLDLDDGDFTDFAFQLAGPMMSAVPVTSKDGEKKRSLLSRLDSIKLSGLSCSDRSIELMYAELGNLKTLNLVMKYLPLTFLQLLYHPCSVPCQRDVCHVCLPSLTTLSTADVPGDQIRELVQKRKEAGVPLKAVYMEENDEVTPHDLQWLKDNVEEFDFFEASDDEFESLVDIEEEHEASESEWEEVDD
ncbi:uncharacterized protein HD556DRAFT_241395 [Suillus plorans]|uniref:F-box domain-containing protein n=1 Tax=Suillus plorans TaxID=116603 RepID=A0A9P7DLF4_9AGAM|nr:uncharacterized protein HD556DRAFT_241395 [Suillus plorans]KAG1797768.1 hypothetical protein HD556DRAFT_241395 [Suillus plorans]